MNSAARSAAIDAAVRFMLDHDDVGFTHSIIEQGVLVKSYGHGVFLFDGQTNRQTLVAGKPLASIRQNV